MDNETPDDVWARYNQPNAPPLIDPSAPQEGIVPLGHDRGVFYYLSKAARQVFALSAAQHTKTALMAMASNAHFWERDGRWQGKNGVVWDQAIDYFMNSCRHIGIYNPDRIRGRGAWIDDGRSVLHVGDQLIVDGQPASLLLSGSHFVYEAATHLTNADAEPLSNADAHQLVTICNRLRWERKISGTLLAGFIVVAPICGGLSWRPSIWVTGGSGSGKSYLKDNILSPALGGIALLVQSKTSEAGIRQTLGSDARPVLFDEAEAEDQSAMQRMQGVFDLMRQSSSEGGADIVKGSADGKARRYRIRSCFYFSAINVPVQHQADANRITVLALREKDDSTPGDLPAGDSERQFQKLNTLVTTTITPPFAAGLLARSVKLMPTIRRNAETFARAVSIHLGSRRMGDQLGALLAGAYSLHSTAVITDATATAYVEKHDWAEASAAEAEKDEVLLLGHITQHRIRFTQGSGPAQEASVGRLIEAATTADQMIGAIAARAELLQFGVRVDDWIDKKTGEATAGIFVSSSHSALKRIMQGTSWSSNWTRSLGRLPGALASGTAKRFAYGHQSKATFVPLSVINPPEDNSTAPARRSASYSGASETSSDDLA